MRVPLKVSIISLYRKNLIESGDNISHYSRIAILIYGYSRSGMGNIHYHKPILQPILLHEFLNLSSNVDKLLPLSCPHIHDHLHHSIPSFLQIKQSLAAGHLFPAVQQLDAAGESHGHSYAHSKGACSYKETGR